MGTNVSVWFWTDDEAKAAKAAEAVFAEMKRLDKEMTTWDPGLGGLADQHRGRRQAGRRSPTRRIAVIERALDVSKRSNGVFDITVGAFHGPVEVRRGHGRLAARSRRRQEAARADRLEGHRRSTRRSRPCSCKRKGMAITLGGIAKGYAVDKCVDDPRRARASPTSWCRPAATCTSPARRAAIRGSSASAIRAARRDSMFAIAPIEDHSFSTSGDYERGFVKDGVRYHHILDPRTGQPAHASRSVTIRAKDAFTADAWSQGDVHPRRRRRR